MPGTDPANAPRASGAAKRTGRAHRWIPRAPTLLRYTWSRPGHTPSRPSDYSLAKEQRNSLGPCARSTPNVRHPSDDHPRVQPAGATRVIPDRPSRKPASAALSGRGIISPLSRLSTGFLDSLESQGSVDLAVFPEARNPRDFPYRHECRSGCRRSIVRVDYVGRDESAAVQGTAARLARSW